MAQTNQTLADVLGRIGGNAMKESTEINKQHEDNKLRLLAEERTRQLKL